MPIRELRTFLAAAESGSFVAAARAVGRTQSAVTAQIKALEDEFGAQLFDRTSRPPALTPAGRKLLPHAADAVAAYDRLYRVGSDAEIEGHLRLGVVPSVITGVMPRALRALRERYPALHVELTMGLSSELVGRVRSGTIDAAVVSDYAEADLVWNPFAQEPLVLIAPLDAAPQRAEDLLSAYPFIRYTRRAWVGQLIDEFLKANRLQIREAMVLDTLEAIGAMVSHGLGVSVVPRRAGSDAAEPPVKTLWFSLPAVRRTIGIVQVDGHEKAPLVDVLHDVLRRTIGDPRAAQARPAP